MVKVVTRTGCAPCRTLKYWLQKKNIEFKEYLIDDSPELELQIRNNLGFSIVPVAIIGDEMVAGLNFARLNTLLGL